MSFDIVRSDLEKIYAAHQRLTKEDVARWGKVTNLARPELCDRIAIYLARGFHHSELTFRFCDSVANDILALLWSFYANEPLPALFWKVYLAFDEGEWRHPQGCQDDPVELYTRPMVAAIVAGI